MKNQRFLVSTAALGLSISIAAIAAPFFTFQVPLLEAKAAPKEQPKRVSIRMTSATAKELVIAMRKAGLNFILDETDIPNRKVSVNVKDVSTEDAIRAVAEALGLDITRKGEIFVLARAKGGASLNGSPKFGIWSDGKTLISPRELDRLEGSLKELDGKLKFFAPREMTKEERAKFEKDMKDFGPKMKEHAKAMAELHTKLAIPPIEMSKEETERFKKAMEGFRADAKVFMFSPESSKDFKKLPQEERAKIDAKMKELRTKLQSLDSVLPTATGGVKERLGSLRLHIADWNDFLKSLTPSQKEKHKAQGYLNLRDLTPGQKKLIGDPKDGQFEIKIIVNGETLVIRSGDEKK